MTLVITFSTVVLFVSCLWLCIGFAGFRYWWTKDFDMDEAPMRLKINASISGPFSWMIGWIIHSK